MYDNGPKCEKGLISTLRQVSVSVKEFTCLSWQVVIPVLLTLLFDQV